MKKSFLNRTGIASIATSVSVVSMVSIMSLSLFGCAEDEIRPDSPSTASATASRADPVPGASSAIAVPGEAEVLRTQVEQLEKRLKGMESHMGELQAQLDAKFEGQPRKEPMAVVAHPAAGAGTAVSPLSASNDPEVGFSNDEAVQTYRKAMVLFQAQKYPESILGFSGFLEGHPDHALAGSAQFYLGESYFRQREYTLALREYQRVITSYDRSSRVSDTLRQMAETEDQLKRPQEAARHRQLLTSLFPQSPSARLAIRAESSGKSFEKATPAASPLETPAASTRAQEPTRTTEQAPQSDTPKPATEAPLHDTIDPPPTAPLNIGPTAPVTQELDSPQT